MYWDMTIQNSDFFFLEQTSLKSTLSLISGNCVYQLPNQLLTGVLLRPADDRRVREGDREGVRGQVPQGRTHHLDEHAPGNSVGFCYFLSKSFI